MGQDAAKMTQDEAKRSEDATRMGENAVLDSFLRRFFVYVRVLGRASAPKFGPKWAKLGAKWAKMLSLRPQMVPKSNQNRHKIEPKMHFDFDSVF